MIFHTILCLSLLSLLKSAKSDESCDAAIDISNSKREPKYLNSPENVELCDSDLEPGVWYYLGGEITSSCVEFNRCSTFSGIWYNGTYPKESEITTGIACAKIDDKSCCGWKNSVDVKKCPKGYIYKLAFPSTCPMSYCVGENIPCPARQVFNSVTGECIAIPKLEKPVLGAPYISDTKEFGSFNATMFSIDCQLKSDRIDAVVKTKLKVETVFKVNDEEIANFIVDYPVTKVTLNESLLVGHIGKTLTCECRLFYEFEGGSFSSKSGIVGSVGLYLGINAVDESGTELKEITVTQGVTKEIYLQSTFPITYGHCFRSTDCTVRRYSFVMREIKKGVRQNDCQITFQNPLGDLVYRSKTPIKISALVTPGIELSKHVLAFNVFTHLTSGILFQGYAITPILLNVVDPQKQPTCHSVGDPHFASFSDIYFNNYQSGDFNLLSTTHRTFQVQIRQIPCFNGISCNCGIIAREGNNLIGINSCDHREIPLVIDLMRDDVNPPAIITNINNEYLMAFVSGVKIKVNLFFESSKRATYLNVYVSGLKHEEYEGICAATSPPANFDVYKIPYAESFFKSQLPACVNETFQLPACQCLEKKGESASVFCDFAKQNNSTDIVKFENICGNEKSREKRSVDSSDLIIRSTTGSNGLTIDDVFKYINRDNDKKEAPEVKQMSQDEATGHCAKVFEKFKFLSKCKELEGFDHQALQQNCLDDVQFSGDAEVANVYLNVLEDKCICALEKEIVIIDGQQSLENITILTFLEDMVKENDQRKANTSAPWNCTSKPDDKGFLKPTHYIIFSATIVITFVVAVSSLV